MASVLLYSVFTAACGFATTALSWRSSESCSASALAVNGQRSCSGINWPAEHRGKALGLMQSSWAIGYGLAALVNMIVLPAFGWRAVFFVGVLPAFLTVWSAAR
jgi:MFS family permease